MTIVQMVEEAYQDFVKRKGHKPKCCVIGVNTYHRLTTSNASLVKTLDGYTIKGCKVVFSKHENQLQFGDQ